MNGIRLAGALGGGLALKIDESSVEMPRPALWAGSFTAYIYQRAALLRPSFFRKGPNAKWIPLIPGQKILFLNSLLDIKCYELTS